MRFSRITIIRIQRPEQSVSHSGINEELQYLGESLGLFSDRDKDKSCFRIFIVLLKALKTNNKFTSDEIAAQTNLTRGTVIHHLNRLMEAGIVTNQRNTYTLSVDNITELVEVVKKNLVKTFDNLKPIAKSIDERLEI